MTAGNAEPGQLQEPEPAPLPVSTPPPAVLPPQETSRRPSEILPPPASASATATSFQSAMQNPDRLDAHAYRPVRTEYQPQARPYYTDDVPWDCPSLPYTIRLNQLRHLNDGQINLLKEYGAEQSSSEDNYDDMFNDTPAETFLTGKAASTEISLKNLNEEDREKFQASMQKEWDSWTKFGAVEVLTKEQIENLPDDVQIIGTRWIHVDKNSKPRLLAKAMQKKTGKTDAQIKKEFPFQAKSRLVVQGCQENPTGIRSDSPTASLLAFNLICSIAVMKQWVITSCDASTAYLQSQGISRLLLLRPPRPPPMAPAEATSRRYLPLEAGIAFKDGRRVGAADLGSPNRKQRRCTMHQPQEQAHPDGGQCLELHGLGRLGKMPSFHQTGTAAGR